MGWPIYSGKIIGFTYQREGFGCDYGEYRYEYSIDGNSYRGIFRAPYFIRRSLDAQRSNSIGAKVQVRVHSNNPENSVLTGF